MSDAENGEQATLTDDVFEPRQIKSRLPNSLTDAQERAMVAAIRNPDASMSDIAEATNVERGEINHALDSIACGVLGSDSHSGEWISRRDGAREAETYAELTDKQKAVVDFLARHPSFGWRERSSRELLAAIEDDDGEATRGFEAHYTYPKRAAETYPELIHERRAYLVEHEGLELDGEDDVDVDASDLRPGTYTVPRTLLERAGYALPDRNLDSLDEVPVEELTSEERLELAYERGQGGEDDEDETVGEVRPDRYLGPLSCPRCGTEARGRLACAECLALKVHDDAVTVENRVEDDLDLSDIRRDVIYEGFVNAVEDYGAFVTIAGRERDEDDVSGLLHVNDLPFDEPVRDRLEKGDTVYVLATGVHDEDANAVTIEWPTEDRLKAASGYVSGPPDEPPETTDEGEDGEQADESATSAVESDEPEVAYAEVEDLRERIEALEHELAGVDERRVADIEDRVDELASVVPTNSEMREVNEAASAVVSARDRMADLDERLGDIADRVDALESAFENSVKREVVEQVEANAERIEELSGANDHEDDLAAAIETLRGLGIGVELKINANETHE